MSFMSGLHDKNARGYLAGNVRDANMKEIRKVLGRYSFMKSITKNESKSDDETSDDENIEIKQISEPQSINKPCRLSKLENRVTILEEKVDIINKDMRDLKDIVLEIKADIKQMKNNCQQLHDPKVNGSD